MTLFQPVEQALVFRIFQASEGNRKRARSAKHARRGTRVTSPFQKYSDTCRRGQAPIFLGTGRNASTYACHLRIGSLSNDNEDGSKNVDKKVIYVLSNYIASLWNRSICQIEAILLGVEFLRKFIQIQTEKGKSPSYVGVLNKTSH